MNPQPPQISILIPCWNGEAYLAETLESVVAQTLREWELIVVDDGSTDGTPDVARSFAARDPRIRLVQVEHGGISAAFNHGYQQTDTRSRYLAWLGSDDLWEPDALQTMAAALDAEPAAVAVHALSRYVGPRGEPIRPGELEKLSLNRRTIRGGRVKPLPIDQPTTFASLIIENCIVAGPFLVRRASVPPGPLCDPSLVYCEDWDLNLRLARRGDILFIPKVLHSYRRHSNNVTDKRADMEEAAAAVLRTTARSPDNTPEQRKAIASAIRYWHAREVRQKLRAALSPAPGQPLSTRLRELARTRRHLARCIFPKP